MTNDKRVELDPIKNLQQQLAEARAEVERLDSILKIYEDISSVAEAVNALCRAEKRAEAAEAQVGMLREALDKVQAITRCHDLGTVPTGTRKEVFEISEKALSATAEAAEAYERQRRADVVRECIEALNPYIYEAQEDLALDYVNDQTLLLGRKIGMELARERLQALLPAEEKPE